MKLLYSMLMLSMLASMAQAAIIPGVPAPDFSAAATGGETVSLSALRGQWVVLYFYPKASTPGCTKQGCSLRDGYDEIQEAGAVIYGVSVDKIDALESFKAEYQFPFELISDADKQISKAYDTLGFGGLFSKRITYIINPKGEIAEVMDKIDVNGHDQQVLAALKRLQAE